MNTEHINWPLFIEGGALAVAIIGTILAIEIRKFYRRNFGKR